jgi:hypothetical protein
LASVLLLLLALVMALLLALLLAAGSVAQTGTSA